MSEVQGELFDPLAEWTEEPKEKISVEQLDQLVELMAKERREYDEAKAVSTELYNRLETTKARIQKLLELAGKTSWKVDGLGTTSIAHKLNYKFPVDVEDRKKVFEYIKAQGEDTLTSMLTINYNTFNAFCKAEFETAAAEKRALEIPGVDLPTEKKEIRFRKGK